MSYKKAFSLTFIFIFFIQMLPAIEVWTASCYKNIFRDACKLPESNNTCELIMAKNEAESLQILIKSNKPFTIEEVKFSDLKFGKQRISADNISNNYVEYVYMKKNSWDQSPETLIRTGEGYYPDPLSNNESIEVRQDETQPLWITVHVPENCTEGFYEGYVHIKTNIGNRIVNYSVEVCDIAIPDADKANFDFMHHQQISGTWYYDATKGHHPQDVIKQIYGWNRWTPQWWELVEDMSKKMKESRCNVLFVNSQQLLLDGGTVLENGKFKFDWSKFDEYIQFFLDRKVVKKLEGLHFGSTIGDVGKTFKSYVLKNNEHGILCSSNVEPMGEDCDAFFSQFVPALYNHLKEKGWLEMWMQHLGDEAVSDLQHRQYSYYMEKMKTSAPDMHCGDPTFTLASAHNAVQKGADIVTPIEELYQKYKVNFDSLKQEGVKVYVYNCCGPGHKWLNRFIDKPVWQQRSLGWLCYKWGISGWLHWGWNFWVEWYQDKLHTIDDEGFKGDHYSVYPDIENNKIKNSIREIAIRDMSEDYELLTALGKKNHKLALELVDKIAVDASENYTTDIEVMKQVRKELLKACAEYNH